MHNPNLNLSLSLRENACDGFWKTFQPRDDRNQNILHPPLFELVHECLPGLGPFGVLGTESQLTLGAIALDIKSQIDRFVFDCSFVADFDPQSVKKTLLDTSSPVANSAIPAHHPLPNQSPYRSDRHKV
jgi:hypothetical protein